MHSESVSSGLIGTAAANAGAAATMAGADTERPSTMLVRIVNQSPIGIAVIDFDGCFRSVNPAYGAMCGYTADELLGRPFTSLFPADQRARVLALHQGFLVDGGELKGEWEVVRRNGEVLTALSESVRVPGPDGQPHRLVSVIDITARKRVELALTASKQFLQSVLDGLTAHVCVLDDTGTVVAVNQAWRDFAAAEAAVPDQVHEGANYLAVCDRAARGPGANSADNAHCAEAAPFAALLREVLDGRRTQFQLEYTCHSPTEQRWFLARVSRIAGSVPPRFVVAHDNVTALKAAQQTLRDSEALLLDLTASIPGAMFRLVHRAGDGWRFVYFSPGLEALFELTPEQACGDVHALGACILPEDKRAHDASVRAAVRGGRAWEHEYRIRTASGRLKWVHVKASPKPDAAGKVMWTGMLTDVSVRKQMEAGLKASEQKYRTLFETVPQGVVYQDRLGRITSANPAALRILGLTLAQMQSLQWIDPRWQALREDGSDFPGDEHPAMVALRTGEPVHNVVMGVAVPGRGYAWLLVNATPLFRNGLLDEVYASFEDITERVLMSRELHHQASTDYLTGVANRRCLMDRLQLEHDRLRRHPAVCCSVLSVDLDHFKLVNDTWGHAAGDEVLRHVARLMGQATRTVDLVSRSGGEEFTLLLPDTDTGDALALAERLRQRVADVPAQVGEVAIPITVSIGVGLLSPADASPDAVLARADAALYEAKNSGRNLVRLARLV